MKTQKKLCLGLVAILGMSALSGCIVVPVGPPHPYYHREYVAPPPPPPRECWWENGARYCR